MDTAPVPVPKIDPQLMVARCPECPWKAGPCATPDAARAAEMKHIEAKHARILAFLRGRLLPEVNSQFARNAAGACFKQNVRIAEIRQNASRIVAVDGRGPALDLQDELRRHIENANGALISIVDLLLEMRTGSGVIHAQGPAEQPQQPEGEAPAAGEEPQAS